MTTSNRITLHVNGDVPITLVSGTGDNKREIRMPRGWVSAPEAFIQKVSGGFDSSGRAKGGQAAVYFNKPIRQEDGKMRPVLQLGTPLPGEEVHVIEDIPGMRTHYRTRQRAQREARQADAETKISRLEAMVQMLLLRLLGGGGSEIDLEGLGISGASIESLDLEKLVSKGKSEKGEARAGVQAGVQAGLEAMRAELAAARESEAKLKADLERERELREQAETAYLESGTEAVVENIGGVPHSTELELFDIDEVNIGDLPDRLQGLCAETIQVLILTEMQGKRRRGALDALGIALDEAKSVAVAVAVEQPGDGG